MFRVGLCAGSLLIFTAIVQTCRGDDGCPQGLSDTSLMKRYKDSCYQFVSAEKFWFAARDHCRTNGGCLVRIDDAATNDFIVQSLNSLWWRNNGVWIGLHDVHREMNFQWTGHRINENYVLGSWTNWARGHPGAFLHSIRDCVRMVREKGQWKWHETVCSAMKWHYRFICQYDVPANKVGVQLSLTQNSPAPPRQNNSPPPITTSTTRTTPTTTTVATTFVDLSTTEEMSELLAFPGGMVPFLEAYPEGQNQEKVDERTTEAVTEVNEQTLDEETLIELETFYEVPELAEINSQQVATEYDNTLGSKGLVLIIVLCSALALSLVVAAILLIRRRRNQKTVECVEESNDANDKSDKSDKKNPPPTSSVVSNIYVTDDDIRNDVKRRAAKETTANDDDVTEDYDTLATSVDGSDDKLDDEQEMTEDCGMMGYDMPRQTNVYDEIPELNPCPAAEDHEYESLDDVIARVLLDDVTAGVSLNDVTAEITV